MNAWREELLTMLNLPETKRLPALRRSRKEDFLYATDLPQAAVEEQTAVFCREAEKRGWRWEREEGWIQLLHTVETPPEGWYDGPFGPEADCCRSLLKRHSKNMLPAAEAEAQRAAIALIKAGEEGYAAYALVCFRLHRKWAENLRRGEALPSLDLRFFGD